MEIQARLTHLRPKIRYIFEHTKITPKQRKKNITIGIFENYLNNNGIPKSGLNISNYKVNNVAHNGYLSMPTCWYRYASVIVLPQLNGDLNYYIHKYL